MKRLLQDLWETTMSVCLVSVCLFYIMFPYTPSVVINEKKMMNQGIAALILRLFLQTDPNRVWMDNKYNISKVGKAKDSKIVRIVGGHI